MPCVWAVQLMAKFFNHHSRKRGRRGFYRALRVLGIFFLHILYWLQFIKGAGYIYCAWILYNGQCTPLTKNVRLLFWFPLMRFRFFCRRRVAFETCVCLKRRSEVFSCFLYWISRPAESVSRTFRRRRRKRSDGTERTHKSFQPLLDLFQFLAFSFSFSPSYTDGQVLLWVGVDGCRTGRTDFPPLGRL